MSGAEGSGAASNDVISDHTCAPWMILLVPILAFGYILVRAGINFACGKTMAKNMLFRDFLELFKVLALLGGFVCSTLLILFLMERWTDTPDGTVGTEHKTTLDEILDLEFSFIAAISLLTVFTTAYSWQMRSEDGEILDENGYVPKNVFMDLGDRSMVRAIITCFGQNILFIYIMGGVWSKFNQFHNSSSSSSTIALAYALARGQLPAFSTFKNGFVFLVTTAFVQHLIWDQMGDSFEDNIPYWKSLWMKCCGSHVEIFDSDFGHHNKLKGWLRSGILRCLRKADEADDDQPNESEFADRGLLQIYAEPEVGEWVCLHPKVARHELIVRIAMSWWINGVVRKMVVMLVPLMLISLGNSYLDFAQNATALCFIVQLDDPVSGRRFRVHDLGEPSMRSALLSC
jgi:hypothetical protein